MLEQYRPSPSLKIYFNFCLIFPVFSVSCRETKEGGEDYHGKERYEKGGSHLLIEHR